MFEHVHQMARKTGLWSPAAHHEISRGTIKNHGELRFWHMAIQAALGGVARKNRYYGLAKSCKTFGKTMF